MNVFYKNYLKAFYFKKFRDVYYYDLKTCTNKEEKKIKDILKENEKNLSEMIEHFQLDINKRISERHLKKKEKNKLISETIIIDGIGYKYNPVYEKEFYYI